MTSDLLECNLWLKQPLGLVLAIQYGNAVPRSHEHMFFSSVTRYGSAQARKKVARLVGQHWALVFLPLRSVIYANSARFPLSDDLERGHAVPPEEAIGCDQRKARVMVTEDYVGHAF